MRNPKLKAILFFLAAPVGLALAIYIVAGPMETARLSGAKAGLFYPILGLGCAMGAGTALYWAIVATSRARTEARLSRGEGVIGRWHVGTADWLRFLEEDAARSRRHRTMRNRLKPQSQILGTEIDVTFGQAAVLIDGLVFPLRRWARQWNSTFGLVRVDWLDGAPAMLEFHGVTTRTSAEDGISVHKVAALRVPVPDTALETARAVLAHYAALLPADVAARMERKFAEHFAAAERSTGARSGG